MTHRRYFTTKRIITGDGNNMDILHVLEPAPNEEIHYEWLTLTNETNKDDAANLLLSQAGDEYYIASAVLLPLGVVTLLLDRNLTVQSKEHLIIRIIPTISGSIYVAVFHGYRWQK